jgi:hypothetical protein
MVLARLLVGVFLSFGAVVVLGLVFLTISDIVGWQVTKSAQPIRVVYMGRTR